jgi:hypothetical protein
MNEFVSLKGFIVRKDNIIFVKKGVANTDIEFATSQNGFPQNCHIVKLADEAERDKSFDKIMVALTGDLE